MSPPRLRIPRDHQDPTGVNSAPLDQDSSSISSSAGNQESAKALLSSESSDPPIEQQEVTGKLVTGKFSYWQTDKSNNERKC